MAVDNNNCSFLCGVFMVSPLQAELVDINTSPVIILEKVNMEQAVAGSEFVLTLNVRNISKYPGFNLNLDYKVKDSKDDNPKFPFILQSNQEYCN